MEYPFVLLFIIASFVAGIFACSQIYGSCFVEPMKERIVKHCEAENTLHTDVMKCITSIVKGDSK